MTVPDPPAGSPRPLPTNPPPPRRIRSLPDRARATRLPGTYAGGHSDDLNWRRGAAVLWTLFGLIAVAEACDELFSLLAGNPVVGMAIELGSLGHVIVSYDVLDLLRLGLLCVVFLSLWFGQGWTRWLLAIAAFFYGGRCLVQVLTATDAASSATGFPGPPLPPRETLLLMPVLGGGFLYLLLSGYLAFSGDVIGFVRHRREEGRDWVVVPVALLMGGLLLGRLFAPFIFQVWLESRQPGATRFSRDAARAVAEHWDLQVLDRLSDGEVSRVWPVEAQKSTMSTLSPLGPLDTFSAEKTRVRTVFERDKDGFAMQGEYHAAIRCAHGGAEIDLALYRSLFGPWRLRYFSPGNLSLDQPPADAPAATPAASPVPPAGG